MTDPRTRAEHVRLGLEDLPYQSKDRLKEGWTRQKDAKASFQELLLAKPGKSEVGAFLPSWEPGRWAWRGVREHTQEQSTSWGETWPSDAGEKGNVMFLLLPHTPPSSGKQSPLGPRL